MLASELKTSATQQSDTSKKESSVIKKLRKPSKVSYWKNPTPPFCCPCCSNKHGRLIGNSSDCGHTEKEKEEYRKKEDEK